MFLPIHSKPVLPSFFCEARTIPISFPHLILFPVPFFWHRKLHFFLGFFQSTYLFFSTIFCLQSFSQLHILPHQSFFNSSDYLPNSHHILSCPHCFESCHSPTCRFSIIPTSVLHSPSCSCTFQPVLVPDLSQNH